MKIQNLIRYSRFGFLVLLTHFFIQCSTSTLNTNKIALKLAKLETEGTIRQSEKKDAFLLFFEEQLIDNFSSIGFGHRIKEIKENWNIYEDNGFVIFTGSVAKTDKDIFVFTLVYKNEGGVKFNLVYEQIGKEKKGKYPDNIIPN